MSVTQSSDGTLASGGGRSGRRRLTRRHGWRILAAATVATGGLVAAGVAANSAVGSTRPGQAAAEAPIGIISAVGVEQAPILAAMQVTKSVTVDGYLYYVGTIDGHPVVDAFGGEVDESSELATLLLISHFHPRAMLFSGTAGAEAAPINVGDVVVSAFVIDKSNLHYQLGNYQTPYEGVELHLAKGVTDAGEVIAGYEYTLPTPKDAKTYGAGPPTPTNKHWVYVEDLTATRQLVKTSEKTPPIGTTTLADATGVPGKKGTIKNKVIVGVIGQAPVWTEPLPWLEAEDAVYQSDAEENEGTGFAFACASQGVPWMLIRGISDTPWHPNAYDGVVSSDHAAEVVVYVVDHLGSRISAAPARFGDLSPESNARVAGYIIAKQAWYRIGPVTKIVYTATDGKTKTLEGAALKRLEKEYTYGASKI